MRFLKQPLATFLASLAVACLVLCPVHSAPTEEERDRADAEFLQNVRQLSHREIEKRLPTLHPSCAYVYAARLMGEGKMDEAVFWFYVGQLRFRFHLKANPTLPPSGDPALFSAMTSQLSETLNLYAGADVSKWSKQINDVLKWDVKNDNRYTSKTEHKAAWEEVRAGLVKMRDYLKENRAQVQAQREANGIGRVGIFDGVYVEERNSRMPKDWPSTCRPVGLGSFAGVYQDGWQGGFARLMFPKNQEVLRKAKRFKLSLSGDDVLKVEALSGDEVLAETPLKLSAEKDGFLLRKNHSIAGFLEEGTRTETAVFHTNKEGDIVLEQRFVAEGKSKEKTFPVRLVNTHWTRIKRQSAGESK